MGKSFRVRPFVWEFFEILSRILFDAYVGVSLALTQSFKIASESSPHRF